MYCSKCGQEIDKDAVICMHCGYPIQNYKGQNRGKSWVVAVVLCACIGGLGAHRFYTGHILTGFLQLITLGGLGIWSFVDLITILLGGFKTADGEELQKY